MRYTICWFYEGGVHYVPCDRQITAMMVARGVRHTHSCVVTVYQGDNEVITYRDGQVVA